MSAVCESHHQLPGFISYFEKNVNLFRIDYSWGSFLGMERLHEKRVTVSVLLLKVYHQRKYKNDSIPS